MSAEKSDLVLVIDDCQDNLFLLELILTESGYRVEKADCGQEGIRKAKELIPDLIILDMMMPDMSGIEVVKKIQVENFLAQIPVLLCTANKFVKLKNIKGVADICYKPFDLDDILTQICALIACENTIKKTTLVVDADRNDPLYLEQEQLVAKYHNDLQALAALQTEGYEINNRDLRQK